MFELSTEYILNDEKINVGKVYKIFGEITYGIKTDELEYLKKAIKNIETEYLSDIIVFDLMGLRRWDSLGIRAVIPSVLKLNEILAQKGRSLIGIIGDANSDLYAAMKDKHPDVSSENLPWYSNYDEFSKQNI